MTIVLPIDRVARFLPLEISMAKSLIGDVLSRAAPTSAKQQMRSIPDWMTRYSITDRYQSIMIN